MMDKAETAMKHGLLLKRTSKDLVRVVLVTILTPFALKRSKLPQKEDSPTAFIIVHSQSYRRFQQLVSCETRSYT
jgi:hypothetical protein